MDKCCTSYHSPRPQRRINGLQLPLNYQQVIGWIAIVITALINFIILVEIQFYELKMISLITYTILYISHIVSHVTALLMDPSEKELRKLKVNNVPEFDRSVHAHVIENGRCHLCNIYTSSRNTKHCSLCNKCVDHFDHHCKWLNNCIGQRNYAAFITCVTTALLISLFTSSLCITDIALFLRYPEQLSTTAQNFINCSSDKDTSNLIKYCKSSISFLTFSIIYCVNALAIACALLHLCCFHIYISMLGLSTYEYIVKSGTSNKSQSKCNKNCKCCVRRWNKKLYENKHNEINAINQTDTIASEYEDKNNTSDKIDTKKTVKINSSITDGNVTNLISVLINNELDRAKKIFIYDKNKIHPYNGNEAS